MAKRIVILKYVYYGITLVSIAVIALSAKYLLGGYEPLVVESIGPAEFTVAGIMYDGEENSAKHQEIIESVQQYIENGKLKGEFALVHYPSAQDKKNFRQFIGAVLTGNVLTFPSSLEIKEFEAPNALGIEVEMHTLFRPGIKKIRSLLVDSLAEDKSRPLPIVEIQKAHSDVVGWYMPVP